MRTPVVQLRGISFTYGAQHVLRDLHLSIPAESIFGLLGPNGAGKTTLMMLLLGLKHPQQGSFELFGWELSQHRQEILSRVGALVEEPALYAHLTGKENLEVFRRLRGLPRNSIARVLTLTQLGAEANQQVRHYSQGMRQRLGLALALLSDPELLILDEPTNGLDPAGIRDFRQLLLQLTKEQKTILLSSHALGEVEKVATHVAVLLQGQLNFQGTLDELQTLRSPQALHIETESAVVAAEVLLAAGFAPQVRQQHELVVPYRHRNEVAEINRLLVARNIPIYGLQPNSSLENIFLALTHPVAQV